MSAKSKSEVKIPMVETPTNECNLDISSNGEWMRLTVEGKLVASFHVNYVRRVLEKAPR